jgi:hypothetical protein
MVYNSLRLYVRRFGSCISMSVGAPEITCILPLTVTQSGISVENEQDYTGFRTFLPSTGYIT